jgi:hypothetical protein
MTNGDVLYEDDYKPRNILLTGGAGFIGSHVACLLADKYPEYNVRSTTVPPLNGLARPNARYVSRELLSFWTTMQQTLSDMFSVDCDNVTGRDTAYYIRLPSVLASNVKSIQPVHSMGRH